MPLADDDQPKLVGCYPASLTVEQCHTGNRNQVLRSSRRWKEFVAIEEKHGLDLLPCEPRARAYGLAVSLHLCTEDEVYVERGWRVRRWHPPFDPAPYVPVLAAYLSEARLTFLLSDIYRLAKITAHAATIPLLVRCYGPQGS